VRGKVTVLLCCWFGLAFWLIGCCSRQNNATVKTPAAPVAIPAAPIAVPAAPSNPRFTRMNITFITGVADKAPETRLEVFLVHDDGNTDAAYLDVHGQGYGQGSTITPLPVIPRPHTPGVPDAPPLYLNDLGIGNPDPTIHENILVKVTHDAGTNTKNSWNFNFTAILNFDDGTRVVFITPSGSSLEPGAPNSQRLWNLKTAIIARPEITIAK